jgi:hypothetical protein
MIEARFTNSNILLLMNRSKDMKGVTAETKSPLFGAFCWAVAEYVTDCHNFVECYRDFVINRGAFALRFYYYKKRRFKNAG